DLAFGLRCVEERERGQGVVALPPFGWSLRNRLGIGQRQCRRRQGHLRRPGWLLCADAAKGRSGGRCLLFDLWRRLRRLLGLRRDRNGRYFDFRWDSAFLGVLRDHFATLFVATPLFAPLGKRFHPAKAAGPCGREQRTEESPERKLR